MLVLVVSSIILFALCAWFLAKPFRESGHEQEVLAQARQYALARDRILRQLEQLEAQADEGVLEAAIASDESLRLEVELAEVLKHLEALDASPQANTLSQQNRLQWLLAMAVFALIIPLVVTISYGSWQAKTLLTLAGITANDAPVMAQQSTAPAAFPPEVLEMVARLEKRMADSPDDGEGWKRLGRSYRVMGRRDEALSAYRKAAALLPDDADVRDAISQLTTNKVATTGQGQPAFPPQVLAMVAQLEKRLTESPNDGEGWKRLGRAYTVMKRYSEAVSAYTSAAELLPNDQSIQIALQELSQIAANSGLHKNTAAADEKGQAAHPPLPKASLENIIRLEKAVAKQPDNPIVWAKLGQAYIDINRQEEAIRALAKAHKLAETDVTILSMYAEAVFNENPRDPDGKALRLYTKLNQLSPRHPDGLWFLGLAAYSEGNLSKTIDLWRQLLTVLPQDGEGYASVKQALSKVEILLNKGK